MKEHKTSLFHLNNDQIMEAIFFMIKTEREYHGINFKYLSIKARQIGIYMMNLTDEACLNEVVKKIQEVEIVKYDPKQIKDLFLRLQKENGNIPVSPSIKAKYYGVITQYLGFEKVANFTSDVPIPKLFVEHKDGKIYSNLQSLILETCRKLEFAKSAEIQKLPFEERKRALKKGINEKLDFKFIRNTKFVDEYIAYSEKKLKYAFDDGIKKKKTTKLNSYPNIFSGHNDYCNALFNYLLQVAQLKQKVLVSTIYYYFKKKSYFSSNLTLEKYIEFSLKHHNIKLSRVFQKNFKMEDNINDAFNIFEENFKIQRNEEIL